MGTPSHVMAGDSVCNKKAKIIADGGNGKSDTTAAGDDVQVVPKGNPVAPGGTIIEEGPNCKLDTTPGGDDVVKETNTYNVDFMDPWRGQQIYTRMTASGDKFKYQLKAGPPFTQWTEFFDMVAVSPRQDLQKGWKKIGTDIDGSDGWSVTWDICENIPSCTYYKVRATMKDSKGNYAKTYLIVHIKKPEEVPAITPIGLVALVGLLSIIAISKMRRKEK